jgi:hypothetical protein
MPDASDVPEHAAKMPAADITVSAHAVLRANLITT